MLPLRTILHPTDFSERSEFAFRLACSLAQDHGAKVAVLHVVPPPAVVYGETMTGIAIDRCIASAKELLAKIQPVAGVPLTTHLESGEAAAEILKYAEGIKPDMIVMGSHGRTGVSRLLLGSTAEQVMRRAECPVLCVKQPFAG
jgi:nucleotide-binding universal stress UspA family protein